MADPLRVLTELRSLPSPSMALSDRSTWRWTMAGWAVFTVSAVLFTIDSVRNGSVIATAASLTFLVGCALFIRPAWSAHAGSTDHDTEDGRT